MPLPRNRWKTAEVDEDKASSLSDTLGLPRVLSMALVARGIDASEKAEKYLNPRLSDMSDPFELPDMQVAVDRIWKALSEKEKITVFGDYDVDGITSSSLLTAVLRSLGGDVTYFLPDRVAEGYGLTMAAFNRCLKEQNPDLVITVDCGTGATEVLAKALDQGLDVVVTDHHMPPETLPETLANINPKISSNPQAADIAGVGVSFKLCHALIKNGIANDKPEVKNIDLRDWLDLVAVGTVADMVPLVNENRILVKHGLSRLNSSGNKGLMALKKAAGVKGDLDTYGISFMIGPRINAAGRVGDPQKALELLLTDDDGVAQSLAMELEALNQSRKTMENSVLSQAKEDANTHFDADKDFGVVVAGKAWHPGVIGIVASRLTGMFGKPCVVIGFDEDGVGHGSCRSIEQMNILDVLRECDFLLERCGGHAAAAGLTIKEENLDDFRTKFSELCENRLKGLDIKSSIQVDAWIAPGEFCEDLYNVSSQLQPCGMGNNAPLWGMRQARVLGEPRIIGKDGKHLKMLIGAGGTNIDAIAFGFAEYGTPEGAIDVVFEIEPNTYMGRTTLQMKVKDALW